MNLFKGYQPKDNGKGTPNPPPKLNDKDRLAILEPEQPTLLTYRLVEVKAIDYNGIPYWVIQVWNEQQGWKKYGNSYDNYQDAIRCYDIVIGKTPGWKVLREDKIEIK